MSPQNINNFVNCNKIAQKQIQTGRKYHKWMPSSSQEFFETFENFLSGEDPLWPSKQHLRVYILGLPEVHTLHQINTAR